MKNSTEKHPLQWFEDRIGQFIYRAPIFTHEQSRDVIPMKIKDKTHAKLLFELQRPGRPRYEDRAADVKLQRV